MNINQKKDMHKFKKEELVFFKLLHNAHDTFFKQMFSYPKIVVEHVKKNLPGYVVSKMDLSGFKLVASEFIDSEGKIKLADRNYEGKWKNKKIFYILIEAQSSNDENFSLRNLEYEILIIKGYRQQYQDNPEVDVSQNPVVIKMPLYNGNVAFINPIKKLNISDEELIQKLVPEDKFFLTDYQSKEKEEEIKQNTQIDSYWLFEYLFNKKTHKDPYEAFYGERKYLTKRIQILEDKDKIYQQNKGIFIAYTAFLIKDRSFEAINNLIKILYNIQEENFMNVVQQRFKDEFIFFEQKGRQEGRQEERSEIAKDMLARKVDINLISEVTHLSIEQIKKLEEDN